MGFSDTLSNYEGCVTRPSEAKPHHPPYSKLATALVKLQFSVTNRLIVSVTQLAS